MPKNTELIQLQAPPSDIQPEIAKTETDLLLQPTSIYDRLRHFPDSVYDLSAESKLVKFLKVLLGDAGAGQLRKQLLVQRLQSTLQGSHFYNLDRFYGPLFGLRRSVSELLDFDPYTQTATRDQWAEAHSKDASFRSRIEQFTRAITYGATPTGMELIAEALLSVDVDIYESWVQADSSFQTYQELEDQYGAPLNSENSISIETDASAWAIRANVSALTQSTEWYFPDGFSDGDDSSLRITADGVGNAVVDIVETLNATPGEEYTFAGVAAYFGYDADGSPGELELGSDESLGDFMRARLFIEWYDSGASLLSTDHGDPVWPDDLAQQLFVTATAPGTADTAVIGIEIIEPVSGDEVFFDRLEWSLLNYGDMEGVLYGDLEGLNLPRLSGNERRTFRIRPKRQISLAESYDLSRVIHKLKPADTRFTLDPKGVNLYDPVPIEGAYSDSEFWEIVPKVNSATFANNPYQVVSGESEEQPLPPFSGYQGEAWSYTTDLAGVVAYYRQGVDDPEKTMPVTRVVYPDGTLGEFNPEQAMLPARMVYAGRVVSDAIAVAYPYVNARQDSVTREPTPLFVDAIPIKDFLTTLNELPDIDPFQQNLANRYFVTQTKDQDDVTEEVLEVRMNRESLVNYVTFETARFPHRIIVDVYDTENAEWNEVLRWEYRGSIPSVLSPGQESVLQEGHPHHNYENHWERVRHNFETPNNHPTKRVRLRMRRIEGDAPLASKRSEAPTVPYSLALRGFDIGYRVRSREDFNFIEETSISTTKDMFGSQLTFDIAEKKGANVLDGTSTPWRSDPQPVNYGVVNLFLDTRKGVDGEVIDRFYLDPTHDGAHLTIYYSMDPQELDEDDPEGFMAERTWTPIPRDFTVQQGNIYIPPTRARYWKFEFTSLTPETFENFVSINRKVQLFPRWIVDAQDIGHGHADEALLPGMKTAISVSDSATYETYTDAIGVLRQTESHPEEYKPTESIYISDINVQRNMKDASWVFGFTPWHQGQKAPRFDMVGKHKYETAHVRHSTKVAFFVGLRELKAYRVNWEANDDPPVYFDTYDDFRNLEGGFSWSFDPGVLHSVNTSPPVVAESRTFLSRSPIKAIQFATEQSSSVQLIGDPEFRNPALADYNWDNPDSYLRQGDAQLIYSATDFSVLVIRHVEPPPKPLDQEPGMVQTIHQPVFSWRPFEVDDEAALLATQGGIASPLFGFSDEGRAHAAVRFTFQTTQTNPWYLRVIEDGTETLIAEKEIEGRQGQTVEEFVSFEIPAPSTTARIHLVQEGKSNDSIKLQSMAIFDDSMVWEFSVNGGGDWYKTKEIRNNDNGLLTFPAPGNQLKYRVTAYRDNRWVSAIKIRPHYLGVGNARPTGTHRGANVSYYDQDVPIHEDPMFTSWKKPVPFYWFAASRRFPLLAIEGGFIDSEFGSFYGRSFSIAVDEPIIALTVDLTRFRSWEESLNFVEPEIALERTVTLYRGMDNPESVPTEPPMVIATPEPVIGISWAYVSGTEGGGPIHPMVDPVFSEDEPDSSI